MAKNFPRQLVPSEKSIGSAVFALQQHSGLSSQAIADKLDIWLKTWYAHRSGRMSRLEQLVALCRLAGLRLVIRSH